MPSRNDHLSPHSAMTLVRLRAFVALVDAGTLDQAAIDQNLTRQAISKAVNELEKVVFAGRPLRHKVGNRYQVTELGKLVYEEAQRILERAVNLEHIDRVQRPQTMVGYLPHHAEFIAPMLQRMDERQQVDVHASVLEERHRSEDLFQREVIEKLDTRRYDVVVGPPPAGSSSEYDFHHAPIYTTDYFALMPITRGSTDAIALDDLLADRLLLPPESTRAGRRIRHELRSAAHNEKGWAANIVQESHGTKDLVIHAAAGRGIVIVPGDIAFVFSEHGTLSGSDDLRSRLTWVRVELPTGGRISHEVVVTTLARPDVGVRQTVAAIHEAVRARFADTYFVSPSAT